MSDLLCTPNCETMREYMVSWTRSAISSFLIKSECPFYFSTELHYKYSVLGVLSQSHIRVLTYQMNVLIRLYLIHQKMMFYIGKGFPFSHDFLLEAPTLQTEMRFSHHNHTGVLFYKMQTFSPETPMKCSKMCKTNVFPLLNNKFHL